MWGGLLALRANDGRKLGTDQLVTQQIRASAVPGSSVLQGSGVNLERKLDPPIVFGPSWHLFRANFNWPHFGALFAARDTWRCPHV